MTSRAKRKEVIRIDRCDRCGDSVNGMKVVKKGRRSGGICHNDKPGQKRGKGDGKCLCRKWDYFLCLGALLCQHVSKSC